METVNAERKPLDLDEILRLNLERNRRRAARALQAKTEQQPKANLIKKLEEMKKVRSKQADQLKMTDLRIQVVIGQIEVLDLEDKLEQQKRYSKLK